jgi:hypothetical protein
MSTTKAKPKPTQSLAARPIIPVTVDQEVFTLAEAAAYLRVSETDILSQFSRQDFPDRKIGNEWRFLKTALRDWLRAAPGRRNGLLGQIGALQDDPHLEEMLQEIYRRRGRPEVEEG